MRIKVLHVIDHLGYGGAPFVVKNIAEGIHSDEIETRVCALRANPLPIPLAVNVVNLNCHKYSPWPFLGISRLCKEHSIDIIHAHLQKSVISSLLASFFCDSKIIIHEHGPIFDRGTGSVYRLLLKSLAPRAALAIANSQATRVALKRATGLRDESIPVIENFVNFAIFDPARYGRDKIRANLGIAHDKIVVGFTGRLDFCKGADLLIQAASTLCKYDERYFLVIVGYGPQRNKLENLVGSLGLKDKVLFTGLCKNPAEVIGTFDIAVVPSRCEAFGISAVEFMRMKIPLVAASVGGLAELVRDEQTGILLEQPAADSIAKAVDRLAKDTSLRERLKENAEVFSRKFDGKEQLRRIEEIYHRLCS
jgi:glycosyltransferase involved in cell wall biosynthesis